METNTLDNSSPTQQPHAPTRAHGPTNVVSPFMLQGAGPWHCCVRLAHRGAVCLRHMKQVMASLPGTTSLLFTCSELSHQSR